MPLRQVPSRVFPVARVVALLATALASCAYVRGAATTERLPDGKVHLKCKTSLAQCLSYAEEACNGARYKVLGAVDQHDYLGSKSTVGEQEFRASEAIVECGRRGRSLFSDDDTKLPPLAGDCSARPAHEPKEDRKAAKEAPPPPPVCVPGATQECVGPGACRGAQACLPNHSGYTACDCGTTPSSVPPTATGDADAGTPPSAAPRPVSGAPGPAPR